MTRLLIYKGTWLYAGSVPTGVCIIETDIAYGTGDYEDDPETAEDRPGRWFYIGYSGAGELTSTSANAGPFTTAAEAIAHVDHATSGTVTWDFVKNG